MMLVVGEERVEDGVGEGGVSDGGVPVVCGFLESALDRLLVRMRWGSGS